MLLSVSAPLVYEMNKCAVKPSSTHSFECDKAIDLCESYVTRTDPLPPFEPIPKKSIARQIDSITEEAESRRTGKTRVEGYKNSAKNMQTLGAIRGSSNACYGCRA